MGDVKKEQAGPDRFLEADLYGPIRDFLTLRGYTVRSEVKDCDVVAWKDGQLLIVELKKHLSVNLLIQAVKRQQLTAAVYLAVPKPSKFKTSAKWKDLCILLKRLGLGLFYVSLRGRHAWVELVLEPLSGGTEPDKKRYSRQQETFMQEFNGRSLDGNVGGSTGKKLLTAYREDALQIACLLERFGPLTLKQLRELGTVGQKTAAILQQNFYGWFIRVGRGCYALSESGKEGLTCYPEPAAYYRQKLQETTFLKVT